MIVNFIYRNHISGLKIYSETWAAELHDRVQVFFYDDLANLREIASGTCVFSDVEFLSPAERAIASNVAGQLMRQGSSVQVLNHPGQMLPRYRLLREMHAAGQITFRAVRALEARDSLRFPVFVRHEIEHWGNLSELLDNAGALDAALLRLATEGHAPHQLLVIEYCDTSGGSGLFRKYSAFNVGGQIIPRHLIFSRHWVQRVPDLLDEEKLREEQLYLGQNPHQEWLRQTFARAGVDYGRIDYGMLDGEPELWEINTNPWVLLYEHEYQPAHLPAQRYFAGRVFPAVEALARSRGDGRAVSFAVPADLRDGVEKESRRRKAVQLCGDWSRGLLAAPFLGKVLRGLQVLRLGKWLRNQYRVAQFRRQQSRYPQGSG
jgi:hypothetical protein